MSDDGGESGSGAAGPLPLRAECRADFERLQAARHHVEHWGGVAARELHWFHSSASAWLSQGGEGWSGWLAVSAAPVRLEEPWSPWLQVVDQSAAPFVRWFVGGHTNSAFNELDRHVPMHRATPCVHSPHRAPPLHSALLALC